MIDSYSDGLINKAELGPRITRMRERIKQLEEHRHQVRDEAGLQQELHLIPGRLEDFNSRVKEGFMLLIGLPVVTSYARSSNG